MKEQEIVGKLDIKAIVGSPYAFHLAAAAMVIFSLIITLFLPKDTFLVAPGILGDSWSLMGVIAVLAAVLSVNLIAAIVLVRRDKVLFWTVSAASAVVSAGILMKVASVAYFW